MGWIMSLLAWIMSFWVPVDASTKVVLNILFFQVSISVGTLTGGVLDVPMDPTSTVSQLHAKVPTETGDNETARQARESFYFCFVINWSNQHAQSPTARSNSAGQKPFQPWLGVRDDCY